MLARVWLSTEDARLREALSRCLGDAGYRVGVRDADGENAPDAALLDFPGTLGEGRARLLRALASPAPPVVLALCPQGMIEAGIAALKEGAEDFVLLPVDPEEVLIRVQHALARRGRGARLPEQPARRDGAPALHGSSRGMAAVREQIERVAAGRATVLITGETGTGKELVAGLIHAASPRRLRPMVKVNCAALPDPLLESELFGHERGAFTGAEQRRIGRFEEADGGTLFLDEIGDMHLRTQAKVLRALQEQEFERLGGTRTVRVDVRVIAATNQDLRALIAAGGFREDLFFRLNVVPIRLPALRERPSDIPELVGELLVELNRGRGRPLLGLTSEAAALLAGHPWPGNVRELRNALERAVLMGDAERIGVADLGLAAASAPEPPGEAGSAAGAAVIRLPVGGIDHMEAERQLLIQALERASWVQKDAAELLRMSRRKLNYRIQKLGITHPGWRRHRGDA